MTPRLDSVTVAKGIRKERSDNIFSHPGKEKEMLSRNLNRDESNERKVVEADSKELLPYV